MLQLVPGIVLARKVKEISPETKIVIGGIDNRSSAQEIMEMCPYFDFAIWGEGEYPLLELAAQIESTGFYKEVSRLLYRDNGSIKVSGPGKDRYLDLKNYLMPDYREYKESIDKINTKKRTYYPVNTIRSCHWKRCKFCNYNTGYKYRERPPENIVAEIDHVIKEYGNNYFMFVDNDIVGTNINRLNELLDRLIEYKKRSGNSFYLWCEMIPHKDMNDRIIKRMAEANFKSMFIGFEAVTDNLLRKMDKSNDFAMNLFMVRSALKNNIRMHVNIIKGIPDESREDVLESINNLHYLRFFFNDQFSIVEGHFGLSKAARYYKELTKDQISLYNENSYQYYTRSLIKPGSNLFEYTRDIKMHIYEWYSFSKKLTYYRDNKFSYEFKQEEGVLSYKEYVKEEQVKNIDFKEKDLIDVLKLTKDQVVSFDQLLKALRQKYPKISKKRVTDMLEYLKSLFLLYYNYDKSRIVSVVDIK